MLKRHTQAKALEIKKKQQKKPQVITNITFFHLWLFLLLNVNYQIIYLKSNKLFSDSDTLLIPKGQFSFTANPSIIVKMH